MVFINDDFLLGSEAARRLYHDFAAAEPILDYHNHLPPKDLARNRQFANLFEIWLEGDHYKWRAMRANGIDERFVTGDAPPREKFLAWARTVPYTLRNPLYHWTHLELKRYFGIDELLDERTAESVWERANAALATGDLRVWGILAKFKVRALCTTDDPTDDLRYHKELRDSNALATKVYPAFRPDKALRVDQPEMWNGWIAKLEAAANCEIATLPQMLDALRHRVRAFHEMGCRASDHGLDHCYAHACTEAEASGIFSIAREGTAASQAQHWRFASYVLLALGRMYAEHGWTMQLHLGARRNANTRMVAQLGPDTGYDSMGDWRQADGLGLFLDRLEQENALPKTIVYNNNPVDNYSFATMIGNFQDGRTPGKIQFGSGWWFLDQKEGMEWQLNALSNVGLLSRFVGMLTDSRSFMSFPRHEYFRRTLCNVLGREMETGELPPDYDLVGGMVRRICFQNAKDYLRLDL